MDLAIQLLQNHPNLGISKVKNPELGWHRPCPKFKITTKVYMAMTVKISNNMNIEI